MGAMAGETDLVVHPVQVKHAEIGVELDPSILAGLESGPQRQGSVASAGLWYALFGNQ